MIECFCGLTFNNKYQYSHHSKNCKIYQSFKDKYLSYDNLYNLYMIKRMLFKEIMSEYPYNKFGYYDFQKAQISCKFPQIKILKSGKRLFPSEIDDILNYDYLYDKYINQQMSTYDICNDLNNDFDYCTILRKLTFFNIDKRTASEANKTDRHKIKQASDQVQSKVRATNLKKYGVEISSKSQIVKDKAKKTSLERYGTEYPIQCKLIRERSLRNRSDNNGVSKISLTLFDKLVELYPSIKDDIMYGKNERIIEDLDNYRCFLLDFSYIKNDVKFDIEFNGDYYHANPKIYKETDICNSKTAKEIWKYDNDRKMFLHLKGFKVLTVWEYDYSHNKDKVIRECLDFIKSMF